jgi:hypothetical protein
MKATVFSAGFLFALWSFSPQEAVAQGVPYTNPILYLVGGPGILNNSVFAVKDLSRGISNLGTAYLRGAVCPNHAAEDKNNNLYPFDHEDLTTTWNQLVY